MRNFFPISSLNILLYEYGRKQRGKRFRPEGALVAAGFRFPLELSGRSRRKRWENWTTQCRRQRESESTTD